MGKAALVAILFVVLAASSLGLAQAQVPRENPDNLTSVSPYDADRRLALSLQEIFGSLDDIAAHVNASDFAAAREALKGFDLSYVEYKSILQRSGMSQQELQALLDETDFAAEGLRGLVDSAEMYHKDYNMFLGYRSAGDSRNATLYAARLQGSFLDLTRSSRGIDANGTVVLKMLEDSSINTARLEDGLVALDDYVARVTLQHELPASLIGEASLTLVASAGRAAAGDVLALTARLALNGSAPGGRAIDFYADGNPIGNATTDDSGTCTLNYLVDGRSFRSLIRLSAEFVPQGESISPAVSNVVEVARLPETASVSATVVPEQAAWGDLVTVRGDMYTITGFPVPGHVLKVYIGDKYMASTETWDNGTYACPVTISWDTAAGPGSVTARYDAVPGDVLMDASSPPARLAVAQSATSLTLDRPQPACKGGESVTYGGRLASADGRPVPGAPVSLYADDALLGRAETDGDGRYALALAVPFGLAAGERRVRAAFEPGEGKALGASASEAYDVRFDRATPSIAVHGLPLLAFQGDGLNISGTVAIDGKPLAGQMLSVRLSGTPVGSVVTDAGGSYRLSRNISWMPGVYDVSVAGDEAGLLAAAAQDAGHMLVMPFDRGVSLAIAALIAAIAIAGVFLYIRTYRRKPGKKPLPKPTVAPVFEPPEPEAVQGRIEDEIARIRRAGDRRQAIADAYAAARQAVDRHGIRVPPSATHREFLAEFSAKEPALAAAAGAIVANYEAVAFGGRQPGEHDVESSLRSLEEIDRHLSGGKGQ